VTATAALTAVDELPMEDRVELVFRLWERILDDGWTPAPSPELLAELDRRLVAHDADPARALTWEQVLTHVRRSR
jgi:putative addiction module component (TIGR02574 family)